MVLFRAGWCGSTLVRGTKRPDEPATVDCLERDRLLHVGFHLLVEIIGESNGHVAVVSEDDADRVLSGFVVYRYHLLRRSYARSSSRRTSQIVRRKARRGWCCATPTGLQIGWFPDPAEVEVSASNLILLGSYGFGVARV